MMKMVSCNVLNLFVIMLSIQVASSQLPPDQVSAMTRIYEIIENNTAASFVWSNVLKTSIPCSWKGVGCTLDNSSINTISLKSSSISTSEFLPLLCNIATIQFIDVSNNQLSLIPDGLFTGCGGLSGLKVLNFSVNKLIGPLPTFNGFPMLGVLDVSRNLLSGEISLQLDGLDSLKSLDLGWNRFTGNIPIYLGKKNLLEKLVLSGNIFRGEIPVEITKFKNLSVIDLSANELSGSIPIKFVEFTKLKTLILSLNSLSGEILLELSMFRNLSLLNLANNRLRGTLPPSLGNLTNLQVLSLQSNSLSGGIPPQIFLLIKLDSLNMCSNSLNGSIPLSISRMQKLRYLDLHGNNLSGPIPDSIKNSPSLLEVQLGNNQLNGRIPEMPETLQISLNLSQNLFDGPIPVTLRRLQNLEILDISNNRLSGVIPYSLTDLSSLTELLLMNNELSGVVPTFGYHVKVDTRGNKDLIYVRENPSPAIPQMKRKFSIDLVMVIAATSGFPVGLLISLIAVFISRMYSRIRGNLSTPNSIHTPNVDFRKGMKAVADPSNITFKSAFSTFYKAVMPSGTTYLVKKIKHNDKIFQLPRHKQLVEELEFCGSLSNSNVMIPVAYVNDAQYKPKQLRLQIYIYIYK